MFFDARGWERPQWFESNADLLDRYPEAGGPRPHEWDNRWWSPITNAEHLHLREHVGMVDLTAFNEFELTGPGVVDYLQRMCVNNVDVPVGKSVYTPLLTPGGGFRADLTIMRLGEQHFRVVTGAFDGGRDKHWFTRHLPDDGSVTFSDRTSGICTIGVWGPNAVATMTPIVTDPSTRRCDLSQAGFPYGSVRDVLVDGVPCTMFRISYVGESGWEVYTNTEHGLRVWDTIWEAGQAHDVRPIGLGVYAVTGRIEKGYRLMGAELESEYDPVEAGLARPRVKAADFIGKEPYLAARDREPAAVLCTLEMTDHTSADGIARYPTGGNEPILTPRRRSDRRRQGPGVAGDHGRRGAVARHVPADGVPAARARRRGHRAAGDVHERAVPGAGGPGRQPPPLRPRRRAHEVVRILVCVKRVPAPGRGST